MRSSLAIVLVALAAGAAAAEPFALPGGELTLMLPKAAFHGDAQLLATTSGDVSFSAKRQPGDCSSQLHALAAQPGSHMTLEPAEGAPPSWGDERLTGGSLHFYCRQLDDDHGFWLIVTASNERALSDTLPWVLGAVDSALADSGVPRRPMQSFVLPDVGTVSLPVARYIQRDDGLASLHVFIGTKIATDMDCAQWAAAAKADTTNGIYFEQVPDWGTHLASKWSTERARIGSNELAYCRDLERGGRLVVAVDARDANDVTFVDVDVEPVIVGIETTLVGYFLPIQDPVAAQEQAYARIAGPPSTATGAAAAGGVATGAAPAPYVERASLDVIRLAIAGGQEGADGADSRAFAGVRVTMVPQHILSDYEPSGYVTGLDVAAGGAGSAFVGDISWANGYGLSRESGSALSALAVVGYDRVGGGFDPVDGAYLGLGAYARLALGSFAVEGAATTTWSTGADELRARAAILTHVGARVLAIGGFYERWHAAGTLIGASIGLSP